MGPIPRIARNDTVAIEAFTLLQKRVANQAATLLGGSAGTTQGITPLHPLQDQ